jgi:predicted metal-dependent peptidase
VFVVDDSGSIHMKLLTEFLSEVAGALDENTADQLTVIYADTRVHHVDYFQPGDIVQPHELPNGGGGTAFSNSFRWIKENAPDASAVIYLTDLQVNDFGEDPGVPVMWAVYALDQCYDELASKAPFGHAIQVSNSLG